MRARERDEKQKTGAIFIEELFLFLVIETDADLQEEKTSSGGKSEKIIPPDMDRRGNLNQTWR